MYALNNQAYALGIALHAGPILAACLSIMAMEATVRSRYPEALVLLDQADALFEEYPHHTGHVLALALRSRVHHNLGEYEPAAAFALQAFAVAEHYPSGSEEIFAQYTLARLYFDTKRYADALTYYRKARAQCLDRHSLLGQARCLNGEGAALLAQQDPPAALLAQQQAMKLYEQAAQHSGIARTFDELGQIAQLQADPAAAAHYYQQALAIRREHGLKDGLITSLLHYGTLLLKIDGPTRALPYLEEGCLMARELNLRHKHAELAKVISEAYKAAGDFAMALRYHEEYHSRYAETYEKELQDRVRILDTQLKAERADRERERYRLQNVELASINTELNHALDTIKDSIAYAQSIQQALMPTEAQMRQLLPQSFVFFKPKDVVSGDFFWVAKRGEAIVVAVVDCTGHGVPGAFMSLLGINMLNHIVRTNGEVMPQNILEQMNQRLIRVFGKTKILDGMEAAVLTLLDGEVYFSGAGIPMCRVTGGKLEVFPGTRLSLGGRQKGRQFYTQHQFSALAGDRLYLFSDGFKDQMGWHKDRRLKFSSQRFQRLLVEMPEEYAATMQGQYAWIEEAFVQWKGDHPQIDDVLVLGIEL